MGEVLLFQEKKVKAKGLRKTKPNEEKIQQFLFSEEYQRLKKLQLALPLTYYPSHFINHQPPLTCYQLQTPVLFYPGCGADILSPLFFMERLYPALKRCTFVFADTENMLGMIKTVLDTVGVSFKENFFDRKRKRVFFYWKNTHIELQLFQGNIFASLSRLPEFDIYFEKAFRIFKSEDATYERRVFEKLRNNGILISDSGFQWIPSSQLQRIAVPKELSSYGEMVVGVKKKTQTTGHIPIKKI